MQRKLLIFFLLPLCLLGCRPRGVLSTKEMEDILYDLHRAEGVVYTLGWNYNDEEAMAVCYRVVLEQHSVTQAQFDSSLVWYTDNPNVFDKIYPKVLDRLQADLDALQSAPIELEAPAELKTPQSSAKDTLRSLDFVLHDALYGTQPVLLHKNDE